VRRASEGKVRVEAGNLHRHLQKLIRQGLVTRSERRQAPEGDDERRRYYAITDVGRRAWGADVEHMEAIVRAARARRSASTPRRVG
jgi:DNA-binding MarR family transcriptional regulator